MSLKLKSLRQLVSLFSGFLFLIIGLYLTKQSSLGMNSWSVFHDGVSGQFSWMTFGIASLIIGIIILTVSMIFLKTKIGIGTILNIAIIGPCIDFLEWIYTFEDIPRSEMIMLLLIGILLTTFGRSLYISARLGPGPRDGLFVGIAAVFKIKVKYVKITIEFLVLFIGVLLGGLYGIGTVVAIVSSGYLVQFFFKILKYEPKESIQIVNQYE